MPIGHFECAYFSDTALDDFGRVSLTSSVKLLLLATSLVARHSGAACGCPKSSSLDDFVSKVIGFLTKGS